MSKAKMPTGNGLKINKENLCTQDYANEVSLYTQFWSCAYVQKT